MNRTFLSARAAALLWGGTALLLFLAWLPGPEIPQLYPRLHIGELLYYGVPGTLVSRYMPFEPLLRFLADKFSFTPLVDPALELVLCGLLFVFLRLCGAGRRYAAFWAALGLLCGKAFFPGMDFNTEQLLVALPLLCLLCVLVLRQRDFSPKYSVLAGLCIGLSFMARSQLFLFPFLLLALDWLAGRLKTPRALLVHGAALVLVPLAMQIPWLYMTNAVHGKPVLFEYERMDTNIMVSGLGIVMTVDGPTTALAGIKSGDSVIAWFLRQHLEHPVRQARAAMERLWLAFSWQPLLWILGLAAFAFVRRGPPLVPLGLLLLYHAAVYTLIMPAEVRYFAPAWLLLFTAIAAAPLYAGRAASSPEGARVSAPRPLAAYIAVLSACAAVCMALCAAYPSRAAGYSIRIADSAYLESSGSSWLMADAALRELNAGNVERGKDLSRRAMLGDRDNSAFVRRAYLLSLLASGRDIHTPLDRLLSGSLVPDYDRFELLALGLVAAAETEPSAKLAKRWESLQLFMRGNVMFMRRVRTPQEQAFLKLLWSKETSALSWTLPDYLAVLPPSRAMNIVAALEAVGASTPEISYFARVRRYGGRP
ncbi:MAG: hypothetical protein GX410_09155 [Elusimicrobia bacterium]|nr:hypothetical protein [Elusimicrobiota bacterium]